MNDNHNICDIAKETMLGDLMELVVDELKAQQDVWQKLSESNQTYAINRVEARCREAVTQCVTLIASNKLPVLSAIVDQVTFKDGCKAVLKPKHGPLGLDLAEKVGSEVLLILASSSEFLGDEGKPKPEADQPDLPLELDAE
ncbi:MAG: hypothetical protein K6L81_02495 [Agarilytica sp.]